MFNIFLIKIISIIGNCNFDALNNVLKQKFFSFIFICYINFKIKTKKKIILINIIIHIYSIYAYVLSFQ